jgi:2,3-diketo-5-methylthio-1-phosphopentane phosphatase
MNVNVSHSPDDAVLVTDFDGTITRFDFFELACRAHPEIAEDHWERFESGRLTHFEALRRIFAGLRVAEDALLPILQAMEVDPRLAEAVALLERRGWRIIVASAGCDWYIRWMLAEARVALEVRANPGTHSPTAGLQMRLPEPSPWFSAESGIDKAAVVREALSLTPHVAFAGDGRPDLAPALLVRPELRFARRWLAQRLTELGEPHRTFESWHEVALALVQTGSARP